MVASDKVRCSVSGRATAGLCISFEERVFFSDQVAVVTSESWQGRGQTDHLVIASLAEHPPSERGRHLCSNLQIGADVPRLITGRPAFMLRRCVSSALRSRSLLRPA